MTETERKLDLLLGDALAENERLKRELKYQDARESHIGTHGPECWTFGPRHYDCAIRHITEMATGAIKKLEEATLTEEEFRVHCKGVDKRPRDVVLDAPLQMTDDGK
jgi:hypothetical protein